MNNTKLQLPPKLKGLDFSDELIARYRADDKLLMLNIELSPKCNLRCIYCYTSHWKNNSKEKSLELKEYFEIIDQAITMGVKTVTVAGIGEPLCDPNFWDIADYIHNKGLWFVVFTNNTLIDLKTAERLFERNISLIGTLNSSDSNTQDYLSGRKLAYRDIKKGLDNMKEMGFNKCNPTRLALDLFMIKPNYHEICDLFRYSRINNIFPFVCQALFCGEAREHEKDLQISIEELKNKFEEIKDIDEKEFGYRWVPKPPYVAFECNSLYYSMLVDYYGNVRPCYGVYENVGNIRKEKLSKIWNHSLLKKIRNIKKYIKGKCKSCEHENCYGCRCRTYAVTKDIFAEDASCWI